MKKLFTLLALVSFITLLIPVSSVNAYPGGLANGKQAILSSALWGDGETILSATDNNVETGLSLNNQFLTIDLENSYSIKSLRFHATGTLRWNFYNSSKIYIDGYHTDTYPMDGTLIPTNVPDAKYLVVSGIGKINELDAFITEKAYSAPQNLVAVGGDSKVTLSWDEVQDATSYSLKRSTTIGGPYETIANLIQGTTYIDSSVINGITYYYVISAKFNEVEGPTSNEASATPNKGTPNPEPSGNRAILVVTLTTGLEKEFDLPMSEVEAFMSWYDAKENGTGPAKYGINKHNNNKGPFSKRTDYVIFKNILSFEASEYSTTN